MTPFFANYRYHLQTEWLKEREAQNPGANLYAHWMQTIHQQARQSLERTREAMGRYYDRKAKQQPDFKVGDLGMLNAKNIRTKRPSKKNIGLMENTPGIPCVTSRALPNFNSTCPRTTTDDTRRDRWRSWVGGGKNSKEWNNLLWMKSSWKYQIFWRTVLLCNMEKVFGRWEHLGTTGAFRTC